MVPWCSGLTCGPVKAEIAGSNPVGTAERKSLSSSKPNQHLICDYEPNKVQTELRYPRKRKKSLSFTWAISLLITLFSILTPPFPMVKHL